MNRYFVVFRWVATDEVEGCKKDSTGQGFYHMAGGFTENNITAMCSRIEASIADKYEGRMKDISVIILFMKELEE